MDTSLLIGIIGVIVLVILLFSGVSVAMSMFIVGFFGYAIMINVPAAMGVIKTIFYTKAATYTLTTIPLFTLMGQFIFHAGVSGNLYKAAHSWLGRVPGGLAVSTEGACAIFAAMCGSSTATSATFATVAMPEMRKYKYKNSLATAAIVSGGTLGALIPPSTPFILYGTITELSIGRLFAAGVFPGILLACCYSAAIIIQVVRHPDWAPKADKIPLSQKFKSLVGVIPTIVLFGIVLGGIFSGIFTANEGAAVGALGGFIMLCFAKLKNGGCWKNLIASLKAAVNHAAMILMIIIAAYVFGYFLSVTRIPALLAAWVGGLPVSRYLVLALLVVFYLFLGMVMDAAAMTLLTVPIFFPVMTGLGFDPIWFGVFIVLMQELGTMTPPVGINLFVVKGVVKDVPMGQIMKGIVPHCLALVACVVIITVFPAIATWLPSVLYPVLGG